MFLLGIDRLARRVPLCSALPPIAGVARLLRRSAIVDMVPRKRK
jgi:hypothetical protein